MRPSDLARGHGLSAQAVRNYERDGFLPPAERTASGTGSTPRCTRPRSTPTAPSSRRTATRPAAGS
ncbi:MerR family DNA-binding transcriptional regulator [Kitasatospora sp. NPDC059812]|uniref:MerR family DNA-binding transcriptional regulator n=1 Tax=unclassified Kitasatospora TaxID=2633591 RepID=UPI00364D2940